MPPKHAARTLGVSIEHLRYAVQHLHRPAPDYPACTAPGSRHLQTRAAEILTTDFLHRELAVHGKDIATLVAETGFSRHMVSLHARQTGAAHAARQAKLQAKLKAAKIPKPGAKPPRRHGYQIDTAWLRTQLTTLRRTNTDIAAELGLSHETIRRHRKNLGITAGATGVHRQQLQRYPHLPKDIRRAVENTRHGWQRLHRFQQVTAYPSVNTAATALGLFQQNLFLQLDRLEADVGTALIHRTGHRYQPMTLTARGRRLLRHLNQPAARQLLDQHVTTPQPDHLARSSTG